MIDNERSHAKHWGSIVAGVAAAGLGTYVIARVARRNGRSARAKGEDNVSVPYRHGVRVEKSVTISQSPEMIYQRWRSGESLPPFLRELMSDVEIIHDEPNAMIGWRSRDDATTAHAGSVHFTPTTGRGTEVKVVLRYDPPGGKLTTAVAKLIGKDPKHQVQEDLRTLKQLLETGEIARAS
jgi:uncharacterized membrane protein